MARIILRSLGAFLCSSTFLLAACGGSFSPQARVVIDMQRAICQNFNLADAAPYVTEASKPMLELTSTFAMLGAAMSGQNFADEFAKECHKGSAIVDEIRVNDQRYIIRYREGSGALKEAIVVMENGQWKVALIGK